MATSKGKRPQSKAPAKKSGSSSGKRKSAPKQKPFISVPTIGLLLIAVGVVLFFCLVTPTNAVAIVAVRGFVNGTFGKLGAVVSLLVIVGGLQLGFGDRWPFQKVLWVQAALLTFCFATLLQVLRLEDILRALRVEGYVQNYNGFLWKAYDASRNVPVGGGLMGAILAFPMGKYLDVVGGVLLLVMALIGIVLWMLKTLFPTFGDRIADWVAQLRDDFAERREEREAERAAEEELLERQEREAKLRRKTEEAVLAPLPGDLMEEEEPPKKKRQPKSNASTKAAPPPPQQRRPRNEPEEPWPEPQWEPQEEWQPEDQWWDEAAPWQAEPDRYPQQQRPRGPEPARGTGRYAPPDDGWAGQEQSWPEDDQWTDAPEWQSPAQQRTPPPHQLPPNVEVRQGGTKRGPSRLYIENGDEAGASGQAYTDYDVERYKYSTRPSRKNPDAIPEFIHKRRAEFDERSGRMETQQPEEETELRRFSSAPGHLDNDARPAAQYPDDLQAPTSQLDEYLARMQGGRGEAPQVEREPYPETPDAPEPYDLPEPERRAPARAAARPQENPLDRQPQLDPETRLDRPDWKPPEAAQPDLEPEPEEEYRQPPFSLLLRDERRMQVDTRDADARGSRKLEETLQSFGVSAKVIKVVHGPAITRFELQPAPGVKVSKIVGLTDDIALNMAAVGVRIEAPIPGKAAIGIEIANKETQTVHLRDVLESDESQRNPSKLAVALGKDIAGKNIIADLARMPHLLIAGQTGSGKSVCINTLITSIMYRATPDEVRMILIDPKKVELAAYNGVPHLLVPVVTDPKKASGALNWAVMEMDERYKIFAEVGVRDIKGYNAHRDADTPLMPQIVVIIDELSDLMLVAPGEVEEAICRIAQLARACGIHLVVATQRPSVNVITGIIKANIPSRIAFEVSSQVDSRTILDSAGAEKLLGKGDMLFAPSGGGKPLRVQGCFVSDDEVTRVVEYVKDNRDADYSQAVLDALDTVEEASAAPQDASDGEVYDALFEQAVEMAIEAGQASISMLQRRLRIGYARAGRLVDEMAKRGIIGQAEGAKPREVLMSREEFAATFKK